MAARRKAAFLDRDGVINRDAGYVGRPEDFELLPGVPEALKALADSGHALIVVTNQSGIGRGYFTEEDYLRTTDRMNALLEPSGVLFDAVLHCPHLPDAGCTCRKPEPGMILAGLAAVGAEPHASVIFGDKSSDIAAGRAAGLGHCLLIGEQSPADQHGADWTGPSLLVCVRRYLSRLSASGPG